MDEEKAYRAWDSGGLDPGTPDCHGARLESGETGKREGLKENPEGCKKGKLINEEMVRKRLASAETYKERGELKYEGRIGR